MKQELPFSRFQQKSASKPDNVGNQTQETACPIGSQKFGTNSYHGGHMNLKNQYKVHTYSVRILNHGQKVETKNFTCTKIELYKALKKISLAMKDKDPNSAPYYDIKEVVKYKNVTSFFLSKEKRSQISHLMKEIKSLYKETKDPFHKKEIRLFSTDFWNSLQNEFYMTADICDNTIWFYYDEFERFTKEQYFTKHFHCEPTEWTNLLNGWYNRVWAREVMKLVKDFNLDNQNPDYVAVFQNDFKKVKNEADFCAAILKWTDLIYWHPEKLSLYDNTFQQPLNSHYDDEFNDDVKDDEENFDFYSQEVSND